MEEEWPQTLIEPFSLSQDDPEVKRSTAVFSVTTNSMEKENPTNQLLEHFSSWHKLKRAVAWQLHALNNTLGRCSISLTDLSEAEKAIIIFCQRQKYPDEMAQLGKASATGKSLSRQSNIYKLVQCSIKEFCGSEGD